MLPGSIKPLDTLPTIDAAHSFRYNPIPPKSINKIRISNILNVKKLTRDFPFSSKYFAMSINHNFENKGAFKLYLQESLRKSGSNWSIALLIPVMMEKDPSPS